MPEIVPVFSQPNTYVTRPTSVTAMQWDGSIESGRRIIDWAGDGAVIRWTNGTPQLLRIETLEGDMAASPGSWIIKGTEGEFYPCKDSVFQCKYQPKKPAPGADSNILLSRHEYAENSFTIDHFTGTLLTSRQDLEELYRQLDDFLYPNPGFEPRIAEARRG